MAITILEAMKLPTFKDFDLVAGYRGLDREIQRASILDYEYESSLFDKPIQTYFEKEDFVISSLIYAKDDQSLILESVKGLISDGVSGLAIKNIYYDELPEKVIKYANQMDFPIFMFDKKGQIIVDKEEFDGDSDELMMTALDAGAEDFSEEEDSFEILTAPDDFSAVREALEKAGIPMVEAQVAMVPQTYVELTDENDVKNLQRTLDLLDEDDDVTDVWTNWDE